MEILATALYGGRSPFYSTRRLRDQRRATRNIISTVLPRRATRSDESVFPRDTGGILQFLAWKKVKNC